MLCGLLGMSLTMPRPLRRCFRAVFDGWLDVKADDVQAAGIWWQVVPVEAPRGP
jgi:hypothetical protein